MLAAILCIGDELTFGESLDTHGQWLSARLAEHGARIIEHRTLPDDRSAVAVAVREIAGRCDLLVITGGLGPTADDLTREALGDAMNPGEPLVEDEQARAHLQAWFADRGRPMPVSNRAQAMRPAGARILPNPNGTAPGLTGTIDGCRVFALPGPPREMHAMFDAEVVPALATGTATVVLTAAVHECGLGEAEAAERLGPLTERDRHPLVGTTASEGIISARVRAHGPPDEARAALEDTVAEIERRWRPYVFGRGEQDLPEVVGRQLLDAGHSLVTAESCTGGWLAKRLVDVAGSSAYFTGGWVTYSNQMKERWLGVAPELLREHGAVSAPVAGAMATGAAQAADADWAVSTTGIAGPDGATPGKPIGTVFIALARRDGTAIDVHVRRFRITGDRTMVRDRSVKLALQMLRFGLLGAGAEVPLLWELPVNHLAETR